MKMKVEEIPKGFKSLVIGNVKSVNQDMQKPKGNLTYVKSSFKDNSYKRL